MTYTLAVVLFLASQAAWGLVVSTNHKLVLVVLDGFSPVYLTNQTYPTPHLDSLVGDRGGVLVRDIVPEFPASRLPYLAAVMNGRHSLDNHVLGDEWYDVEAGKARRGNF